MKIMKLRIAVISLALAAIGALSISRSTAQDAPVPAGGAETNSSAAAAQQSNSYNSGYSAGFNAGQARARAAAAAEAQANETKQSGCCGQPQQQQQ